MVTIKLLLPKVNLYFFYVFAYYLALFKADFKALLKFPCVIVAPETLSTSSFCVSIASFIYSGTAALFTLFAGASLSGIDLLLYLKFSHL